MGKSPRCSNRQIVDRRIRCAIGRRNGALWLEGCEAAVTEFTGRRVFNAQGFATAFGIGEEMSDEGVLDRVDVSGRFGVEPDEIQILEDGEVLGDDGERAVEFEGEVRRTQGAAGDAVEDTVAERVAEGAEDAGGAVGEFAHGRRLLEIERRYSGNGLAKVRKPGRTGGVHASATQIACQTLG